VLRDIFLHRWSWLISTVLKPGLTASKCSHPHILTLWNNAPQMAPAPSPPAAARSLDAGDERLISLELEDGGVYQGYSFGAQKSIAGELVFQTGMVGYSESLTDPSYRGQILVITFPLVGNYGVPSRETVDELLKGLPAHFESSEIHIAGLVTASYAGEDYSHYLATSSLGAWLKEQGVPAMYGVDTRALTKRIRTEGSMLGRILLEKVSSPNGYASDGTSPSEALKDWRAAFETIDWVNPNTRNLVAEGEFAK
jgi:carbamoyl-phosphate synthase / aspartate carbamoyltransferase